MNGNAIKSLQRVLSSNDKEDAGWIIPLKGPPQSTRYRPVLNYILVGNRYLVSEKWQFNHEISKEKARNAIRKSTTRYPQAHMILTKKLSTICTNRRIMSPDSCWRYDRKMVQNKPHRRAFSPKYSRNRNMSIT